MGALKRVLNNRGMGTNAKSNCTNGIVHSRGMKNAEERNKVEKFGSSVTNG